MWSSIKCNCNIYDIRTYATGGKKKKKALKPLKKMETYNCDELL